MITKEQLREHLHSHSTGNDKFAYWNRMKEFIDQLPDEEEPKKSQRTLSQNSAIHLDCKLIAEALNDAGKDMRVVLKEGVDISWTTENVKEYLWKPIMRALYQKESTTDLDKASGEIEEIHDHIMRELGEKHGIEYISFPHDPNKQNQKLKALDMAKERKYPEYEGAPKI